MPVDVFSSSMIVEDVVVGSENEDSRMEDILRVQRRCFGFMLPNVGEVVMTET